MVVLLYGSRISTKDLWISFIVTTGFLVHQDLTRTIGPQLLSLHGRPDPGSLLVVQNLLPFMNSQGYCALGHF